MYYNKWVVLQPNNMLVLNGKQRYGLNLSIIAALKIVKYTWVINHCVPAQRNVACIPNARFVKWLFTFTDSLAWIIDDVATDLPSTHRDVYTYIPPPAQAFSDQKCFLNLFLLCNKTSLFN